MYLIQKDNIRFFVPKKDQCALCEQFNNSLTLKKNLQNNIDIHLNGTKLSRSEKKKIRSCHREIQKNIWLLVMICKVS